MPDDILIYVSLWRIVLFNFVHFLLCSVGPLHTLPPYYWISFDMTIELVLFLWWGTRYTGQHSWYFFRLGYLWDVACFFHWVFYSPYFLPCHFAHRFGVGWDLFPGLYLKDLNAKPKHILRHIVINFVVGIRLRGALHDRCTFKYRW